MDTLIPAWVDGQLAPVDKLAAHVQGLKHLAVSVFVINGDEILIQRRALNKYHTPGLWANTCCTHPLWQEASPDCARRRLQQELGVCGLDLQFRQQLEYRADVGGGMTEHEVVDVFLAHAGRDLELNPDPEEVMDARWISYRALLAEIADAPVRFTPWLRIYLRDHAETILGAAVTAG